MKLNKCVFLVDMFGRSISFIHFYSSQDLLESALRPIPPRMT